MAQTEAARQDVALADRRQLGVQIARLIANWYRQKSKAADSESAARASEKVDDCDQFSD